MAGSRRRGRATAANSTKNAVDADNNNDGVDGSSSKRRRTSGPAAAAALTEKDLSFQRVAARILDSQTKRGVLHYLVEYADPDPDHELTDQDREILATLPKEAWVRGDHACVSDEQIDEYVERSMIILAVVSVRPKSNISGLMLHSSPYAGLELADLEFLAELATPPTSKRKNLTPEKVGWRSWNMLTDEWKERLTKDHKDFLDKAKSSLERLNAIPLVLKETTRSTSNFGSHADGFNEDALGEAFRRKDLEGARRIVEALSKNRVAL
ncbi:hypothetical protein DFJ73DRAFT_573892 [Zopfochytrium polystomum]|nr:hypothetical protein DFJ73DRAFT_573892 [Zopfochytrium polystomum]